MNEFNKQTYSEQAADYIRILILSGKLAPGSTVEEAAIAKKLNQPCPCQRGNANINS